MLRLGDAGSEGLPLSRLAADLGLHKASLHRTLSALRHRDFVEQDEATGAYRLGANLLALADSYLRDGSLRGLLHEGLRKLSAKVSELCHLGTLSGNEIVYVDKVEPQRAIRVWSEIGRRSPALTTALGRAIISHSFADFESFAASFPDEIPARTPFTRRSPVALWEELAAARLRGFAKEEQENEPGITCIAVAIKRGGIATTAISITAQHERMPPDRMAFLADTLRETVRPFLPPGFSFQEPMAS
ncbi:MAG: IclR family transcriptional regulator [Sphingomonadales bacterium]|nr:IclR family transcriptional regulator [Sphingomonadales bacterium]